MLAEAPTTPGSEPPAAALGGCMAARSRRVRRLTAGLVALGLSLAVAACGGNDGQEPAATASATTSAGAPAGLSFTPSPGTDIPAAKVRFAMWPYGDMTAGVVGIAQGWFKDVGIDMPNGKETRTEKQVQQQLLNKQLDIGSGFGAVTIQSYAAVPNLKLFQLTNSFIGYYIWANPKLNAKSIKDFSGGDFTANFKTVIDQMKGKRVVLSDAGENRAFFQMLLKWGGLTTKDFAKFDTVSDTKIVQLVKAGAVDFAFPSGAAQSVQVSDLGFENLGGFPDLVTGLPSGDERVLHGIGHSGLQATEEYINDNRETVLRFMSVWYRIIDELQQNPEEALKHSLPTLNTAIGAQLTIKQAARLFKDFYGTLSFEQTNEFLNDANAQLYYPKIYESQIEAAKQGGIVPKDSDLTPETMSLFHGLYQDLVALKAKYDEIKKSDAPTGALADRAATFYKNRDYLDAYRLIKAASGS